LKILVVSQYFWPEDFRINDLVCELVLRGHEVRVLTGVPNYPAGKVFSEYRARPDQYKAYAGAEVCRVPMLVRGTGSARLVLNYLSFVVGACLWGPWRLRGWSPEVVFVYEPSPITVGIPALLIAAFKKAPVVFWVLDLWPETLSAIGVIRSPRLLKWVAHLVRFIYNRCALVLGQSRSFLHSIARYCSDKTKVRYFPSWAEDLYADGEVQPAPEIPAAPGTFNILFAGNIGDAQDMPAVLEAAHMLRNEPHVRWIILGGGRRLEWVHAEVQRRGLQSQVLLPGRFPVDRMPSFFAHADALLVSLKQDPVFSLTIPGKVQSYLLSGIPVLGMLDGEGAQVIRDAGAGLTSRAGDSRGLADTVRTLLAMPQQQRSQLGMNGRSYAQREFGRAKLMDRLESLLAEAAPQARHGHPGRVPP